MSTTDHWMKLHIGDYLADTMHLNALQHGIYLLLLMHAFKHGGYIPADARELRRITHADRFQWARQSGPVLALFSLESVQKRDSTDHVLAHKDRDLSDYYSHKRVMHELAHADDIGNQRRSAGKRGAFRRWGMANATSPNGEDDGNSHSPAGTRARDYQNLEPQPLRQDKEPPRSPPVNGGERERQNKFGGGRKRERDPHCGFVAHVPNGNEQATVIPHPKLKAPP